MLMGLAAALAACSSRAPKSLSLDEARAAFKHNSEIVSLLDSASEVMKFCASEYGIKQEQNLIGFMPGTGTALSWELIAVESLSLVPSVRVAYSTEEAALAKKAALEKDGKDVFIAARNPLKIGKKPAQIGRASCRERV